MAPLVGPSWLMPDVGDVLGDESLAETFDPLYVAGDVVPPLGSEEEEVTALHDEGRKIRRRRVMYEIRNEEPFMSLSPPPTHLFLKCSSPQYIIHKESLQHWLSSTTLSFLIVWMESKAPAWLCSLLRNLPPNCNLRSLLIISIQNEAEMELEIVDAFCESPACQLDSLGLSYRAFALLNPHAASKLRGKCRSLFVISESTDEGDDDDDYSKSLLDFMSLTDDCKLQELALTIEAGSFFVDQVGVLQRIESCKLKRLDMTGLPALGPDAMSVLVASVASPACCIQDLGISLSSIPHFNKTCFLILAQAFQISCGSTSSGLSKLKVLRFSNVDTDEAAACVVQILGCPQSNCKVRFLQIHICSLQEPFFKRLHQVPPRIECLRVNFSNEMSHTQFKSELAHLSDLLGHKHCSLLWLQCDRQAHPIEESLQMEVANALEANFLLTSLQITSFHSPAARSRATAFLARNRLYKAMGLSEEDQMRSSKSMIPRLSTARFPLDRFYKKAGLSNEDQMKPNVARLFLCGHGEVGKTTLRKALTRLNHNHPPSSPSTLLPTYHGCSFNMCFKPSKRSNQDVEQRTRGLEINRLSFEPTQNFAMFDLGGQTDYHIFHHFFMSNTSHDLFIIVIKHTPSKEASQLESELEYWLRFIVSHRNSVHGPNPKIMIVVNFFHTAMSQPLPMETQGSIADSLTQRLRQKYVEQLDFGDLAAHQVFGIDALNASQVRPILKILKILLVDLLNRKPKIPKLCNDLLSHTLPLLAKQKNQNASGFGWPFHDARAAKTTFKKVIVDYEEVKEHCLQQQDQIHQTKDEVSKLERKIQAALTELHNVGEVVFFPPVAMPKEGETFEFSSAEAEISLVMPTNVHSVAGNATSSRQSKVISPIIIDPNWFCNKVIGDLLAPEGMSGKLEWMEINVKQLLIKSGCPVHFVDEVLRYMLSLDLCYSLCDNASKQNATKNKIFFPAVASEKKLHWPPNFKSHNMHFYGRRIMCKDTAKHLIPSGVFARFQVKLQSLCGVGNQSYRLGYHWASFVKNSVDVMVRFGKVSPTKSVIVDDVQVSITEHLMHALPIVSISMEEDDHPEWIDILLCCPSSHDAPVQAISAEYAIMQQIRKIIFDICQATSRGIPTVVLEECALKHEAVDYVMSITDIEECVGKNGLASYISWKYQERIPIVDLLLPEELQRHIVNHVQAIRDIQGEFPSSTSLHTNGGQGLTSNEGNNEEGEDDQLLYPQLHGESKVLHDLINSKLHRKFERLGAKMDRNFERLDAKMDNVLAVVKEIKQDVRKVMHGLQQAEVNIVARCSTGLLEQLLVQGVLPAYSYLTDSNGKMQRLKNFLWQKKATIHFLCESVTEGPHRVEGQEGREVVVEEGILMKWAPFLVPALMIISCAARFAANAYLPGVAPLFFNPLLDFIKSLGITDEDLKSQIMPRALNALFDKLDVKIEELYDQKTPFININEGQIKEGREALHRILGIVKDLDVERDFGLCLVQVGRRAQWLCKEHAEAHQKLKHPPNPFCA